MTLLEELMQERTRVPVGSMLSPATEQIAEEMAQEILRDPAFRAEMQQLIRGRHRRGADLRTPGRRQRRQKPSRSR
jgi:hypothetical protein